MQQNQIDSQRRTEQIVVFRLGREEYGLTISQIKEVVLTPVITRMPQAQSYVRGVANIRGTVIAILDLEEKFGLQDAGETSEKSNQYTLVIDSNEYKMGVLVRDVPNTLTISRDDIELVYNSEGDREGSYITGIAKLDKRLIIMIDIFKIINGKEVQGLQKIEKIES